jgi:hypothetical protein
MFRRNVLTPFYILSCVAVKHYTHLPDCTTDNMQNQNLDFYRKILEYFHSQLSDMKKGVLLYHSSSGSVIV